MARASHRLAHQHFRLDASKVRRAQKLLGAKTETETVDMVLDEVIGEAERNRLTWEAIDRFVQSGARIRDVTGALDGK